MIHSLAGALAATSLAALVSGCADPIEQSPPPFAIRADLNPGWRVEISSLYRKDAPDKVFTPSGYAPDIWLQSGAYTAKITRCNQTGNDETLEKFGVRLGPDNLFDFSVQGRKQYGLYCTTGPDGTIYVELNDLQIEVTD